MGFNTPTNTFDTFTDLRKSIGQASSSVKVLGQNTINDEFGGDFYWDNTSTASDDNLDVIQPLSITTGRWLRVKGNLQQITSGQGNNITNNAIGVTGNAYIPLGSALTLERDDLANVGSVNLRNGLAGTGSGLDLETDKWTLKGTGLENNLKSENDTLTYSGQVTADRYISTITDNIPASNPAAFYAFRTMDPTVNVDSTGFRDKTTFDRAGRGYNPYDAQQQMGNAGHTTSYQSRPTINGTVVDVEGYWHYPIVNSTANITNIRHYIIGSGVNSGGAPITNNYGIVLENGMIGTNKYGLAFYDSTAKSVHAGNVRIGATTDPTSTLDVSGTVTSTGAVHVTGVTGFDVNKNGLGLIGNASGVGIYFNTGGTNPSRLELTTQTPSVAGAQFITRVGGQDAVNSSDYATLGQVQSYSLPFEDYNQYTDVSATGPNAIIFVDDDNSPLGDNTESQFFRHNNKLFNIVAIEM